MKTLLKAEVSIITNTKKPKRTNKPVLQNKIKNLEIIQAEKHKHLYLCNSLNIQFCIGLKPTVGVAYTGNMFEMILILSV